MCVCVGRRFKISNSYNSLTALRNQKETIASDGVVSGCERDDRFGPAGNAVFYKTNSDVRRTPGPVEPTRDPRTPTCSHITTSFRE